MRATHLARIAYHSQPHYPAIRFEKSGLGIVSVGNWVSLTLMAILVLIGWRGATGDGSSDLPIWLPIGTAVAMVGLGVVSASPWGERFLRLFYPIRRVTKREEAKLGSFDRVQAAYRAVAPTHAEIDKRSSGKSRGGGSGDGRGLGHPSKA